MTGRRGPARLFTAAVAIAAFGSVGVVMATTFAASPDQSRLGFLRWLLLAVWTLGLPPVWGLRLGRRLARLAPARARDVQELQAGLDGLWLEFAALGLGGAVAALAVIRPLL